MIIAIKLVLKIETGPQTLWRLKRLPLKVKISVPNAELCVSFNTNRLTKEFIYDRSNERSDFHS